MMWPNKNELLKKLVEWLRTWIKKNGVTVRQILSDPAILNKACDLAFIAHPALLLLGKDNAKNLVLKALAAIPLDDEAGEQVGRV